MLNGNHHRNIKTACMKINLQHSLENKIALVTGGTSGIGKATVDLLLEHGANVAFTYRENELSHGIAMGFMRTCPEKLSSHAINLLEPNTIHRCFEEVRSRWGNPSILINNAAVGSATVESCGKDEQNKDTAMLLINADGTLKMCQEFLAQTKSCKSQVHRKLINISSVGGAVQVFPGSRLSDGMSKSAVAHLTRQLAAEHVHAPVDIFAVCPGATNTPMFQESTLDKMDESNLNRFLTQLPKQRMIEPQEIANIIVFLASEYSTVLHGSIIDASMGLGVRSGLMTEFH
jgi:NAD(P)-dependent dehydrogenase (short-subunit alcohol dehydrogenase family)